MDRFGTTAAAAAALLVLFALSDAVAPVSADAYSVTHADITFDRWNYPFNSSPGTRSSGPIFGAVGETSFDDRDGQFLIGINTAALGVPTGLDPADYQVTALVVTATHSTGSFVYDPTYDAYDSDSDAGTPIVLTGAGLRGSYTGFTFGTGSATAYAQNSPYGNNNLTPGSFAGDRNAYAAAFNGSGTLIDVSNNVRDGLDITPWAVGVTNLNPGDAVVEAIAGVSPGSTFTFDLTAMLADPNVLGYVQQGFAQGGLFFTISSLHSTAQGGSSNPNFFTSDSFDPAALGPTASFALTTAPEPSSLILLLGLLGGLGGRRRRTRRGR
jgi:hypothetical protein